MEIFREFRFEAAHYLPNVTTGHKCGRLHGHSYRVEIQVTGAVSESSGMVLDFADIAVAFSPLMQRLDHHCLNEILDNPTSENLALWIADQLREINGLSQVVVRETGSTGAKWQRA